MEARQFVRTADIRRRSHYDIVVQITGEPRRIQRDNLMRAVRGARRSFGVPRQNDGDRNVNERFRDPDQRQTDASKRGGGADLRHVLRIPKIPPLTAAAIHVIIAAHQILVRVVVDGDTFITHKH